MLESSLLYRRNSLSVSQAVEVIIANRMVLNETLFGFRSSEKIMSVINQENVTALILTKRIL